MALADDRYGKQTRSVRSVDEVKVYTSDADHAWAMKIENIGRTHEKHPLHILTPSIQGTAYACDLIVRRSMNVISETGTIVAIRSHHDWLLKKENISRKERWHHIIKKVVTQRFGR